MLSLTRPLGSAIVITNTYTGEVITIIQGKRKNKPCIHIDAPQEYQIRRSEHLHDHELPECVKRYRKEHPTHIGQFQKEEESNG